MEFPGVFEFHWNFQGVSHNFPEFPRVKLFPLDGISKGIPRMTNLKIQGFLFKNYVLKPTCLDVWKIITPNKSIFFPTFWMQLNFPSLPTKPLWRFPSNLLHLSPPPSPLEGLQRRESNCLSTLQLLLSPLDC